MMGKEKRLFKSEERKTLAEVSAFLHQLADRISDGKLVLNQGNEEVVLLFSQNLTLEVEAEHEDRGAKGIKHSLEIEIEWYDEAQEDNSLQLG